MRITDLISLCFENLRRRKGRTALTVIGVVVGTCSIVVMVSLGIAMNVGF
ncbi:MAG: ABC transporter permease, partial [Pygmaiobacter massiliensis]|nr:ABC transporter permease [Pygmaiobacter massiliensis]